MGEITNSNVFDSTKRFIDLTGLELFWDKAKAYIDGVDTTLDGKITVVANRATALETTVNGTEAAQYADGLVKKVETLRADVNALGGTEGGIQGMIDATIEGLDLPNTYEQKGAGAAAEAAAKTYADGLNTAMDTRVAALEDVKDDYKTADEAQAVVLKKYTDDAVAAEATLRQNGDDALQGAINTLRGEYEATKGRIDTFLDSEEVAGTIDTLHEINKWMTESGAGATELTEAIAAEAKARKEADEALGGRIDGLAGTVDTNLQAAKDYADAAVEALGIADYAKTADVTSAIATAKSEVMTEVEKKADTTALNSAVSTLEGQIAQALADAKADAATKLESYYTKDQVDTKLADYYTSAQVDTKLADYYTKDQVYTKTEVDGAFTTKLADYYTKSEVNTNISNAQAADQAYARAYTDLLFNSVKFASPDEINGIF